MQTNLTKVVIFNPSIEDGGVEKNLFIITNYLAERIKELYLITTSIEQLKNFSSKVKIILPLIKIAKKRKRYIRYFFSIIELLKFIIKNKNVLIVSFQANIYALIIAYIFNVKIISRSNTAPNGWSKNFLKQKVFNFFLKKANLIVVNSYEFKKIMDSKFKINCKCILNPFNFARIKYLSSIKSKNIIFSKDKKVLRLINVGRLVDQKDQLTILKALKIVIKKRKVKLIIVGKGENEINLRRFIKYNGLSDCVKLIGYQKNPYNYIKAADVFILSSVYEGSPNVLIEAQYLKKYIISTNCPTGPKEILMNGRYGDLYPVGDFNKLAKLIISYKFDKNKVQSGFKSLKKYEEKKSCEEYLRTINSYI